MARATVIRTAAGNGKTPEPVIILAPIGSKGSVLTAALGRHPELFAAPHMNLLAFETPAQFSRFAKAPRDVHIHGLFRLLSLLLAGERSIEGVQAANRWLARHQNLETRVVHRMIAGWLHPKRLVEYSPLYAHHSRVLARVVAAVPNATFIHLVRHPSATAMEIARAAMQTLTATANYWTAESSNQPSLDVIELTDTVVDWQADPPVFDAQFLWYRTHTSIAAALADLPRDQVIRVRAEDLLEKPQATLASICRRLGLPMTDELPTEMLRIEEDAFARPGPFGAAAGADLDFISDRIFPEPDALQPMAGELAWRGDGVGYRPEVIALAEELGYRSTGRLGPALPRWKILSTRKPPAKHASDLR